MPDLSANMKFNIFLENDVVDFEKINENFNKLDKLVLCTESGTKSASYSGAATGNASWYYRKFSDGTIEMYTKLELDNIKCGSGASSPYQSGTISVNFPFKLTAVNNVNMNMASNTVGWVSDTTGKGIVDLVRFNVRSTAYENSYIYKQVYINVKGRWK